MSAGAAGDEAPDACVDWIYELPRFGTGTGLHRVRWLAGEVLSEERRLPPAIGVTGSNGKGSVASMAASVLEALGLTVGLYTSPHLVRFGERFRVDGQQIAPGALAELSAWCRARVDEWHRRFPGDRVARFEAITAMALRFFAARAPDVVVAEAGMGGRFDPVRFFGARTVGISTVELEHAEVLGGTLEQIALDKADLAPPGATLVFAEPDEDLLRRVAAYSGLRGTRVGPLAEVASVEKVRFAGASMRADLRLPGMPLPDMEIGLPGRHQAGNAALAAALVHDWVRRERPEVGDAALAEAIRAGLAAARWPGRLERVASDPETWIDVGHTPRAVRSAAETMAEVCAGRPLVLLLGVSKDKAVEEIAGALASAAAHVVCTRAHHKGSPAATVAEAVRRSGYAGMVEEAEPLAAAVARAREVAGAAGGVVFVAGGLFLAVEAAEVLRGRDPAQLRFV